jgi:hypothetical protein
VSLVHYDGMGFVVHGALDVNLPTGGNLLKVYFVQGFVCLVIYLNVFVRRLFIFFHLFETS